MPKDQERANKIIAASDGAKVETHVMDCELVDWFSGDTSVDLDEVLQVNKRALDYLNQVRSLLKKELTS